MLWSQQIRCWKFSLVRENYMEDAAKTAVPKLTLEATLKVFHFCFKSIYNSKLMELTIVIRSKPKWPIYGLKIIWQIRICHVCRHVQLLTAIQWIKWIKWIKWIIRVVWPMIALSLLSGPYLQSTGSVQQTLLRSIWSRSKLLRSFIHLPSSDWNESTSWLNLTWITNWRTIYLIANYN